MSRFAAIILTLLVSTSVYAQYFGKNKVQYESFDWKYIQSEHFNVYYSMGGEAAAEFTAEAAEEALKKIQKSWNYSLEDRITFITYRSHNGFQQNNVSNQIAEESLGGFTEFLKNRVVLPFTGNYESFRHVIHHELTHAVQLRMYYGSGFQSILIGATTSNIPLWFTEGIAEYESRGGWDVEADMFMRDATIAGYLPSVDELGGYFAYKGGQSVFYFLDRTYGKEKVGEIINKVRSTRDVERSIRSATGLEMPEFNRRWQNWLRKIYWPTVKDLKTPDEFAEKLTDHMEWRNFVNNGPSISPDGMSLAFLSDRTDFFDLWLLNIDTGKLERILKGERSGDFEQLKWLDARLSWSPDGKYITFASKAGAEDAVNILDVSKKKITRQLKFGLDGIFNPSWSHDGSKIAFVGFKNSQSDIYYYNLQEEKLCQITDDVFSDDDPTWSPDGQTILFTSDRQDSLRIKDYTPRTEIWKTDYRQSDIYTIGLNDAHAIRLTTSAFNERSPVFSKDAKTIIYTSDVSGIHNLYRYNTETKQSAAFTNCMTGCMQPSLSLNTNRLAFTSLYEGGYDIYLVKDASSLPEVSPSVTAFRSRGTPEPFDEITDNNNENSSNEIGDHSRPYSSYVFANSGGLDSELKDRVMSDTTTTRKPGGGFYGKKYKVKFTPDYVYATAAYSSFFGAQGTGQILFSDVMGNQLIYVNTDLYYDFNNLENSNFSAQYFYLPKRVNYGTGLSRYVYYFDGGNVRDKTYQLELNAAYPFSKYSRSELNIRGYAIDRDEWVSEYPESHYKRTGKRRILLPELAYTHDTVVWGNTGPINGSRYRVSYSYSPQLQSSTSTSAKWSSQFDNIEGDYRYYSRIGREYSWASRITAGYSSGSQPVRYFLGGVSNWINVRYENNEIPTDNINDFYFSTFVTPFRGGNYFEKRGTGNRYFLTNQEFRFPVVRYLQLGWPLPIGIRDIRGALFTDIGAAWSYNNFEFTTKKDPVTGLDGKRRLADPQVAYGFGMRTNLGLFLLRWDLAWSTDGVSTSEPRYFMSLGAEY